MIFELLDISAEIVQFLIFVPPHPILRSVHTADLVCDTVQHGIIKSRRFLSPDFSRQIVGGLGSMRPSIFGTGSFMLAFPQLFVVRMFRYTWAPPAEKPQIDHEVICRVCVLTTLSTTSLIQTWQSVSKLHGRTNNNRCCRFSGITLWLKTTPLHPIEAAVHNDGR